MIGERIRLAREACGMTQIELAERSSITSSSITDLEVGRVHVPADAVIDQIAQATGFPPSFFRRGPLPDLPDGNFRRLKRGTAKVSRQVRAQVRHLVEIVQDAEPFGRFPPVRIEPFRNSFDLDDIEDIALQVRMALGIDTRSPIPNMTRAAERAGIVVVSLPSEMQDHDGFSAWPDYGLGGRPIIAIARGNSGDRDRYNISHELGHIVLHTIRRDIDPDRAEKEAHRFAGAFLLPLEAATDAIRSPVTLSVLKLAKAAYGTSIGTNAQRALDLRFIDKDHFVSLRKQMSARGWNRTEPIEVASEKPMLIGQAVRLVTGDGTLQERSSRSGLPLFTLRALAG